MNTILITGASSGFGMDTALELASMGWTVFASMRDVAKATPLLDAARQRGVSDNIKVLSLDVTSQPSIRSAVGQVLLQTGGKLDALFSNAGYCVIGCFEDLPDADCRRQMETNFFGTLAVAREVIPVMRKAGRGRIVVTSSNSVNAPHPMMTLYAASKWALDGWAEGLAMELAPYGIEVALVQPGAHRTPFAKHVVPVIPEQSPYQRYMDAAWPGLSKLDRWGRNPAKAVRPIVRAITARRPPFMQLIGPDTQVFSTLKGLLPYGVRAWAVRKVVGLPGPREFVSPGKS